MYPSLRNVGFQQTTGTTLTIPYANLSGPDPLSGDCMFLFVMYHRSGEAWTVPTGFAYVLPPIDVNSNIRVGLMWKRADGTEGGDSVDVAGLTNNTASDGAFGLLIGYTDVHQTATPWESPSSQTGIATTTITDAAVTALAPIRLALNFIFQSNDNGTFNDFTGETGGNGWPSGGGGITPITSTTGADATVVVQSAQMPTSGTIDGGSTTVATAVDWVNIGVALIGEGEVVPRPPGVSFDDISVR